MAQKFTSLYKEDPIAAELEAGIQGTDVYQGSPYALANVPEFEGVRYATPDYNRYQDLYGLYMGGGYDASQDDFPIQAGDITGGQMIDTGAGDAAQIPGAIDTLVAPDTGEITSDEGFIDAPIGTGGDTIMPANLTPDMGMGMGADTVVDTGLPQGSPGMLNPPQSNLENMARAKALGYTPDIVEDRGEIGRLNVSGNITDHLDSTVETRPPEFVTGIQPEEETYADLVDRQAIPMSYTIPGGAEITVDETGGVQPTGMAGDVIEEVSQAPMDPTKMIPQVPPYTDPIMDPTLMGIRQDQLVSQQETPESIGEKLRNLKDVTYDPEKNTVEIAASEFPCDNNLSSLIAQDLTSSNFNVF